MCRIRLRIGLGVGVLWDELEEGSFASLKWRK